MRTEMLTTATADSFAAALDRAAGLLAQGALVALPTETVYGLGADARNENAVREIFRVKGRPAENPVIVHVGTLETAMKCASEWPPEAEKLARAFWPGPLTLVLPKADVIPSVVTAGGPTVGLRMPNHRFTLELLKTSGIPVAAPSANPANRVSPTTAVHVMDYFDGKIAAVIDGGPSMVGIESTVLDLTTRPARVLRPGMVHANALAEVLGTVSVHNGAATGALKSPGMMPRHYSPRAKVLLWSGESLAFAPLGNGSTREIAALCHSRYPTNTTRSMMLPRDPEAYARLLYAALHEFDSAGVDIIVVEDPPDLPEWQGIRDRLRRAAT